MKKFSKFALMGAIALTSTVMFTACSADEEVANINPTYDGSSVKTAFTLSIGDVKTRMVEDAYQGDNAFNGMTDIRIYPALATITDGSNLTLDKITLADFSTFDMNNAKGKIYNDVNVAVGTTDFLFYGTTTTKGNGALVASDLAALPASTSDITFDLVSIYGDSKTIANINSDGTAVLTALNAIDAELTTQITAATTPDPTVATVLTEIQDKLRNKNGSTYGVYAGSSKSIEAMVEDLYNTLKSNNTTYATAVCSKIAEKFTATASTGNATGIPYTVQWTTDPNFPASINLPDGAVAVQYNTTDGFKYVTNLVEGVLMNAPAKYVKPAELYYTVNTKGMVRDQVWLENNKTAADWATVQAAYTQNPVTATTNSIILKDQIQYAVARLAVQAKIATGTIKDSGSGITGSLNELPQPVDVTNGYDLTGILVGGQKQVDWKFVPVTLSDAPVYTIYDGTFDATPNVKTSLTDAISTLVLETSDADDINIALEFVNKGGDFFGKDHKLIPAGTKFYLVAKLSHAAATETSGKVFAQDYTTTAQLTITETSLQNAYNIVPDLRSPKLEFGLSVNLQWGAGHVYVQDFQ